VLARDGAAEPNLVWKDTVLVRTGQTTDIMFADVPVCLMLDCNINDPVMVTGSGRGKRRAQPGWTAGVAWRRNQA
jgi:hypothetical protein